MNILQTSDDMLEMIAHWEGFSATAYYDIAGKLTIGYGHLIQKDEKFPGTITHQEAMELLKQDVTKAENAVKRLVQVELNQNQFDALVSFTFNLGEGNLAKSTLLRMLNNRDYVNASNQMLRWNKANGKPIEGLIVRRTKEREWFNAGVTG